MKLPVRLESLIGDEDAIYDPANFNDRLLLGLKGTISEVELQQIKARMYRGLMNKAKRGELWRPLPIGYELDPVGRIRISANQEVRDAIAGVFAVFEKTRSVKGTLRELARRKVQLPYHPHERGLTQTVRWRNPTYDSLYGILTNECFAGVYAYGKRKVRYNPVLKRKTFEKLDQSQWEVYIPDHHEAYIPLSKFEKNLKVIRGNAYISKEDQIGAAREGINLLQGIVYCLRCGRKMRSGYAPEHSYYRCDWDKMRRNEKACTWIGSTRADEYVSRMLLEILNDGTVDLTFQMMKAQGEEISSEKKRWKQKLSRLEYEANLARRRYESVDPENRLVASTLEKEWNEKMGEFEKARSEYEREWSAPVTGGETLVPSTIKEKLKKLPELWHQGKLPSKDKKEILRCVIERVAFSNEGGTVKGEIHWYGGEKSVFSYPKRLISNVHIYERIRDLAMEKTDKQIADLLNKEVVAKM